jgi:hypothetical protein
VRPGGTRQPTEVAIRIADNPRDEEAGAWVRYEYDVLRVLDDPRIPKTYGFFASQFALAMTWVDGIRLDQLLAGRSAGKLSLDAPTAMDILGEVAEALRHAHSKTGPEGSLHHGWLCPECVWLRKDGAVFVSGFGALPRHPPVGYEPPEQAAGAFVDARSDQWRLGALAIELLLGNPLYTGSASPSEAAAKGDVEPWIVRVEKRWPSVARALRKLLSPAAGTRYANDSEMIQEILEIGRGLGLSDRKALVSRARQVLKPSPAAVEVEDDPLSHGGTPLDPSRTDPGPRRPSKPITKLEDPDTDPSHASAGGPPVVSRGTKPGIGLPAGLPAVSLDEPSAELEPRPSGREGRTAHSTAPDGASLANSHGPQIVVSPTESAAEPHSLGLRGRPLVDEHSQEPHSFGMGSQHAGGGPSIGGLGGIPAVGKREPGFGDPNSQSASEAPSQAHRAEYDVTEILGYTPPDSPTEEPTPAPPPLGPWWTRLLPGEMVAIGMIGLFAVVAVSFLLWRFG